MKPIITFTLYAAVSLSLAAYSGTNHSAGSAISKIESAIQLPNPFVSCDTLEEAKELAGFNISVPKHIDGYGLPAINVMKHQMIQVIFVSDENRLYLRKGVGVEDISGDYNSYSSVTKVTLDGLNVIIKGNGSGANVAIWNDGDYSYAISSTMPIENAAMTKYVKTMNTKSMLGTIPVTWGQREESAINLYRRDLNGSILASAYERIKPGTSDYF